MMAVKINEPLAADAMTFRFPEHALVEHRPAANGMTKVELWGADDRPIKVIKHESEDLREYAYLAPRWPNPSSRSNRTWYWSVALACVFVGGWFIYRRMRS